tara:strand:+ start:10162 stop:12033 length:1872 start_codon:yes stop_codon:yes gene_type:complete
MQFQAWFFNGYGLAGLLALGITTWAIREHLRYSREFQVFEGHIRDGVGLLSSIAGPGDFYHRLRSLAQSLESNPVLGQRWKEYQATLLSARGEKPLRSPRAADEFFNEDLYRSGGIDVRAYEALPNQFVGVGLCLTFFGLIFSLFIAQNVISASADQATSELSNLLQAASFKFITSVVALVASVVFVFAKNRRLFQTEKEIGAFCDQLERLIPPVTPEELAEESNQELARQGEQLEAANKILATGIADALEHKLTSAMKAANEPMLQTIRHMTERLSDINRSALEHMAQRFSETLAGAAREHTDRMAEQLKASAEAIGEAPHAIKTASILMNEELRGTAEAMDKVFVTWSSRMTTASDDAAARLRSQADEHASALSNALRQESAALLEGLSAVADEIVSAPTQIRLASEAFETTIQNAAERMSSGFDAASSDVSAAYAQAGDKAVAGAELLDGLIARTQTVAEQMQKVAERTTAQISSLFEGANEVTERLRGVSADAAGMSEAAQQLAAVSGRIEGIGSDLNSGAKALADVAQLAQQSSKEGQLLLIKMGERAAGMDRELQEFDAAISGAVQKLGQQIEASSKLPGEQLKQIDQRVADSLDSLNASVRAFNEAITGLVANEKT